MGAALRAKSAVPVRATRAGANRCVPASDRPVGGEKTCCRRRTRSQRNRVTSRKHRPCRQAILPPLLSPRARPLSAAEQTLQTRNAGGSSYDRSFTSQSCNHSFPPNFYLCDEHGLCICLCQKRKRKTSSLS